MISKEAIEIASKMNYLTPSRYVSGRIIEYDLEKANISILYSKGMIDKDKYDLLYNSPKMFREIMIGNMIKDNREIYECIKEGQKEARLFLVQKNNINERQIVRCANDAIFINSSYDLSYLAMDDYIHFRPKSVSNVMIQDMYKMLIFVTFLENGSLDINIKGMNPEKALIHQNYLCTEIARIIFMKERIGTRDAIKYLQDLIERYVNLELPKEFYIEFNAFSAFRIKGTDYYTQEIDDLKNADISYNLYFLRYLFSLLIQDFTP